MGQESVRSPMAGFMTQRLWKSLPELGDSFPFRRHLALNPEWLATGARHIKGQVRAEPLGPLAVSDALPEDVDPGHMVLIGLEQSHLCAEGILVGVVPVQGAGPFRILVSQAAYLGETLFGDPDKKTCAMRRIEHRGQAVAPGPFPLVVGTGGRPCIGRMVIFYLTIEQLAEPSLLEQLPGGRRVVSVIT